MASSLLKLAPAVMLAGATALCAPVVASAQTVIFAEDFECLYSKLELPGFEANNGASGNGGLGWANVKAYTHTPPAGWLMDNSGVPWSPPPDIMANEWRGWSFARKDFWASVAGDQTRTLFTKGQGIVAVADPDEYDDSPIGIPGNQFYNTFLKTPAISLANVQGNSVTLTFDSSWRPEGFDDGENGPDGYPINNQTGIVRASFDGGTTFTEILRWDSDVLGTFFHPDSQNETVNIPITIPSGAQSLILNFGMELARNDWWWAIDNISVTAGQSNARTITGSVSLEGCPITQPFEANFTLHAVDNSIADFNVVACVNAQGNFTLRNLPPKNYRLKFKPAYHLARVVNANVTAADANVTIPISKVGDANQDDAADISDLLILINAYNSVSPATTYSQAADFNCDGTDDISDLLLLINNYNGIGEGF